MFLLVPAYPGCPGQTAVKWLLLLLFSGTTRVSLYQKGNTNLDFNEAKRVAVASAGLYASLHLAPDR